LKNAIAIFLILCANLVLLVHAIVPHHHHDDAACFVLAVEEKHDHDHCCDHNEANHQDKHKPATNDDCCVLNDLLAIIPDTLKQDFNAIDFSATEKIITHYLIYIASSEDKLPILNTGLYLRQEPFPADCRPAQGTLGVGLRAPPQC
jgi:hypothetical protein